MLAKNFKFHIVNKTGVQLDFNGNSANEKCDLDYMLWKFDSDGATVYDTETNKAITGSDVADDASAEFTEEDNATGKYVGGHGMLRVETDNASALGRVRLYIEYSTDGGTTYPSDAADFDAEADLIPVASVDLAGDGAGYVRSVSFEF